jgi:hypothetical protein
MAISKQHEYYEKKLDALLKEMPDYVAEYVDAKQDIRSPITLFNYVRDYREFFNWLMAEGIARIAKCERINDISPDLLANLSLDEARNYFKFIGRKKYKVSKKDDETRKIDPKTVNRHKSSLRSLFKSNELGCYLLAVHMFVCYRCNRIRPSLHLCFECVAATVWLFEYKHHFQELQPLLNR